MLRRLDVKDQWRSLDKGFWPDDLPAGCRTVVYGHNGSGKSTLSELLLSLAEGETATDITWEDEGRQRSTAAPSGVSPSSIAVFTRKWVEANLAAFLDGDSASAIVTLGRAAIDAKEEESRLGAEIERLREDVDEAEKQRKAADRKVDKVVREVQDRIVSELKAFDYNHFTKNRYSIPRVQDDLRKYTGEVPGSEAHAEALKRLGEGAPAPVAAVPAPPSGIDVRLAGLRKLLADTPTRVALEALEGHPSAQAWVEQGLSLHDELDRCLFCAGPIASERRDQLARHFDESWLRIRSEARDLRTAVIADKEALAAWVSALPRPESLASDLQSTYEEAVGRARADIKERTATLEAVETALNAKVLDPNATPEAPEWALLGNPLSTAVLVQAVAEHNDQARRHEEVASERKQIVLNHLVGSQSDAFRQFEEQAKGGKDRSATSKAAADLAERRLDEVRQAQFTTKDMADTLTSDLARVYGKDHLSVAVTGDGKSYACRRGDKPGRT